MKRYLLALLLPLLALAACEKPFEEQEDPQSQAGEALEFTAVMEQVGGDTKTTLGADLEVLWQARELMVLYYKANDMDLYELHTGAGTTQGTFTRYYPFFPITPTDLFVAFSPIHVSDPLTNLLENEGGYTYVCFTLPKVQKYVKDSYDPAAFPMIAISETDVLPFKNVAGLLKLNIKGSSVVNSIILSTSETIAGKANVTTDAVLTLTGEEGEKSILMDCGESGVQLNETAATAFYFVLPPVDLSTGFKVEIQDNENGRMVMTAPAGLAQNKIERNRILSMPEITYKSDAAVPMPSANEIVVRMADPAKEATGVNDDPASKFTSKFEKVHIHGAYWKYVHKNGPLKEIPSSLFAPRTVNFEEMILPEGLESIATSAFADNDVADDNYYLKKVVLPTTLKTIASNAFQTCKALEEIVFNEPESSHLESIGVDAFRNCTALRSVVLPDNPSVKSFVFGGFRDCANLTSVNIPENTATISERALAGTALKSLIIPEGVTTIGMSAFEAMAQLENVVLPEGITVIPESLFSECSNLTSLRLPSTVTKLGGFFILHTKITSLDLPDGLEGIEKNAFFEAPFTSFTIPSSVKTMGHNAIQSTAPEFTVTVEAPESFDLADWDANWLLNGPNCHLVLHASRKDEVTGLKWRNSSWNYKSITFIDDSGNVVNVD